MHVTSKKSTVINTLIIVFSILFMLQLQAEFAWGETSQTDQSYLESTPKTSLVAGNSASLAATNNQDTIEITQIEFGAAHTAAVLSDESLWMWGRNAEGELGDGTKEASAVPIKILDSVSSVVLGGYSTAAIKTDGSLWMWGQGGDSIIHYDHLISANAPQMIMNDVKSVSLGYDFAAVIKTDGSLWTWGYNGYGQLGDGTKTNHYSDSPVKVMDDVSKVVLGHSTALALKTDGSLWSWGLNDDCVLGTGDTFSTYEPVKILDNVKDFDFFYHAAALVNSSPGLTDSLWVWGENRSGEIGDGTTSAKLAPLEILHDVSCFSLGGGCTAALKNDGTVLTWGSNSNYRLGDGTSQERFTPVAVMDSVSRLKMDGGNGKALKSDGSLWSWGLNEYGAVGNGTTEDQPNPVEIIDDIAWFDCGYSRSYALKTDGSLWGWGSNGDGQIGNSEIGDCLTPVCIFRDGKWVFGGSEPASRLGTIVASNVPLSFCAHTKGNAESTVTLKWDDSWFESDGSGYIYNHDLATAASVLAFGVYKESTIKKDYETLGFDLSYDGGTYMPSPSDYERTVDLVGYSLAIKDIDVDSGTAPLIAVSVRGTPGNDEWLSNLNLSNSSRTDPYVHHEGLDACKEEVLEAIAGLVEEYKLEGYDIDLNKTRVLITGHSRGAAVANLLAAAIDDGELSDDEGMVDAGNVYAYTFASPNASMAAESYPGLYHNINNIVNPEDLITNVPLEKWGYYRYGRTLMLPSISNTSPFSYYELKRQMNEKFVQVSDGSSYKPYKLGAATTYAIAEILGCGVPSVNAYYDDNSDNRSFYHNVSNVVLYTMLDRLNEDYFVESVKGLLKEHPVVATAILCTLWADSSVDAAGFSGASARLSDALSYVLSEGGVKAAAFRAITPIGDEVANGHMPETYVSWMRTIDESFFDGRTFIGMTAKCPVDVYVYDSDDNLVCRIEDDVVDESVMENGLSAYVIDGRKHVDIPNDADFRIELVARESGEMDFTVEEIGGDGSEQEGSKAYLGVPLTEGQVFLCDSQEHMDAEDHVLLTESGEAAASKVLSGVGLDTCNVAVWVEGPGEAWGDREVIAGSSVTVCASANEGAAFDGWYLNGSKVSEEPEYNFKAEESLSLTAKFRGSLESAAVAEIAEQVYTGKAVEPEVVVVYDGITLEAGVDYTVGYSGNVNATTSAEVTITGMGAYTGTLTKAFVIAPAPLDEAAVGVEPGSTYTGEANEPAVDVELGGKVLTEDVDYTVAYSNNVNAGKNAAVVVTGIGNYAGEVRETFTIAPATLSVSDLSSVSAAAYTGLEAEPSVTVKHGGKTLVAGVDYKVAYSNNVNVGTSAKATVTGIGNYAGAVSRNFSITPAKLFSMALSNATYACDGKQKSPSVTVKGSNGATLKEGVDFTLSTPEGRTDPGKYTYKATGKGNYTGSVTAVLEITGTKPAPEPSGKGVARPHRLAGDTALDTMSKIVDAGSFPKGGTVVLATSEGYWDALTAAGVAGLANAPVLMTGGSSLSDETRAQIAKLQPKTIVICGGPAAVSRAVESQAKSAAGGATAIRCQGDTATGTACKIFENGSRFGSWSDTAFVCTNAGYWDALAAAPISYAKHMPIFLTEGAADISDETVAAMRKGGIAKVYVVGGRFAITQAVLDKLGRNGIKVVDRLWGNDAIETSEKVAQFGTGTMGMTADRMGVATNGGYWDALAGAALCGREGSVLVLVDGPSAGSIGGYMAKMKDDIATFYIFGGTAAVSKATENAAVAAAK